MKSKLTIGLLIFCFVFTAEMLFAQLADSAALAQPAKSHKKPFTVNLNEEGTRYIKFGANLQLWGRYSELNPGSKIGSNPTSDHTFDFVIRCLRLQAMGMLTEKVWFHFQLGQNNINFTQNTGPYNAPLTVFDALGEYHFSSKLHVGAGLCGWGAGVSRYSAQSSSTQLTVDAPIYQQYNINNTYGNRNLSIYAKGTLGKLNYRAAVMNPYKQTTNKFGVNSSISTMTPHAQFLGMLTYQFLEKESIAEPYNKATYLGTKRVFNIGIGFMTQPKAMWRQADNMMDTLYTDMKIFNLDVYYDAPVGSKGASITAYGAYNRLDYGKNYLFMVATPNPALSGSGTGFYGIGSGNIFYTQLGYLFKKGKKDGAARPQAYGSTEVAVLQGLKTPMVMFEAGVNYYFTGTFGPKITLGYQNRGIFKTVAGEPKQVSDGRKGMLVLQYQVSF